MSANSSNASANSPSPTPRGGARGRPPSTTHAEVARVALELFDRQGFEETTIDEIAAALGLGRRTLFRYFPSKNDIVWGEFGQVLERLRHDLHAGPPDEPLMEALRRAVVSSNRYEPEQLPELRIRMRLITSVPALQAHSMLRYTDWREVVAEWVAERTGGAPADLLPQTIGYAALGMSMAAFTQWVDDPGADLETCLERTFSLLEDGFASGSLPAG